MSPLTFELAAFIDQFNAASSGQKVAMLKKHPFPDVLDVKHSAYIAAVVEELCVRNGLDFPLWIEDEQYTLKSPYFVGGLESIKAFLLIESPISFRRRNIFVSENVLSRV